MLEVEVPSKNSILVVLAPFFKPDVFSVLVKSNVRISGSGIIVDHPFNVDTAVMSFLNVCAPAESTTVIWTLNVVPRL